LSGGAPVAMTLNVAVCHCRLVTPTGCVTTTGLIKTKIEALELVTVLTSSTATTEKLP
jgi:hypothetical protein